MGGGSDIYFNVLDTYVLLTKLAYMWIAFANL